MRNKYKYIKTCLYNKSYTEYIKVLIYKNIITYKPAIYNKQNGDKIRVIKKRSRVEKKNIYLYKSLCKYICYQNKTTYI